MGGPAASRFLFLRSFKMEVDEEGTGRMPLERAVPEMRSPPPSSRFQVDRTKVRMRMEIFSEWCQRAGGMTLA